MQRQRFVSAIDTRLIRIQDSKKRKFKNIELAAEKNSGQVDFDPASLLMGELRAQYSHVALFFHDRLGGNTIGVAWNPAV
jgi:hypothetical protein